MTRLLEYIGVLIALLLATPVAAAADGPVGSWTPPRGWLASCDGSWVYSPPDEEEPERAQGCTFLKFGGGQGVVWFQVTVLESTTTGKAYLSNGDGFLIESGNWKVSTSAPELNRIQGRTA